MVTKNVKNKYKKTNKAEKKIIGSKKNDKVSLGNNKTATTKKTKSEIKLSEKKSISKLKTKAATSKKSKTKTIKKPIKIGQKITKLKKSTDKKPKIKLIKKSSSKLNLAKKTNSLSIKSKNPGKEIAPKPLHDYDEENKEQYLEDNDLLLNEMSEISIQSDSFSPTYGNQEEGEQNLIGPSKFKPYHIDVTEGYMNEQQLKHFEQILQSWKQELMLEVDNTITEMKEADILADPNDRATQEETFNLELRTRDRERKLIKKIEAALNKITEQCYGYCDSCGIEIGIRRLEARPTATLCIECKTLAEIREKRT